MSTKYSVFILLRATAEWLSLPRDERRAFFEGDFKGALAKHPGVTLRYYDAEAFTTRCSDIAVFEADDLNDYYFLMERLRDSKMCTVPYFDFVDIVPSIEEGFVQFEAAQAS